MSYRVYTIKNQENNLQNIFNKKVKCQSNTPGKVEKGTLSERIGRKVLGLNHF
jgi:hypothetical protein